MDGFPSTLYSFMPRPPLGYDSLSGVSGALPAIRDVRGEGLSHNNDNGNGEGQQNLSLTNDLYSPPQAVSAQNNRQHARPVDEDVLFLRYLDSVTQVESAMNDLQQAGQIVSRESDFGFEKRFAQEEDAQQQLRRYRHSVRQAEFAMNYLEHAYEVSAESCQASSSSHRHDVPLQIVLARMESRREPNQLYPVVPHEVYREMEQLGNEAVSTLMGSGASMPNLSVSISNTDNVSERVLSPLFTTERTAAGHASDLYVTPSHVYKICNQHEFNAYEDLSKSKSQCVPCVEIIDSESKPAALRELKNNEYVVRMSRIGASLVTHEKRDSGVIAETYDFKLGHRTTVLSEQREHGYGGGVLKQFKHYFIDHITSSATRGYRLEGQSGVNTNRINGESPVTLFKRMLEGVPGVHLMRIYHSMREQMDSTRKFLQQEQQTFVGCSLLIVMPGYGEEMLGEQLPELQLIDFAHPMHANMKGYQKQKNSVDDGLRNMISDLDSALSVVLRKRKIKHG